MQNLKLRGVDMIKLEEIADRLVDRSSYDFSVRKESWEPVRAEAYVLPVFHITESKAKGAEAKLRTKLSKVLAFIDSVKHKRFKEGCTIMPVSVSNKENLAIWENKMGVSRAIDYMIEIGLLGIENDKYQFRAYYEKDNKSKSYYYYKENEDKIKAYCEERGIEKYIVQNKVYDMADISKVHKDIDRSKVRFASRLKLIRPDGVSKDEFKKQLTLCLYENYPGLRFHILKANEINQRYYNDYPDFRIKFEPNFTWSDDDLYVSGIGIRATNSMINIKKSKRVEILKEYGFILEKDINASVPRLTLSLNKGEWVDESVDLYELIYRVMEPEGKFNTETVILSVVEGSSQCRFCCARIRCEDSSATLGMTSFDGAARGSAGQLIYDRFRRGRVSRPTNPVKNQTFWDGKPVPYIIFVRFFDFAGTDVESQRCAAGTSRAPSPTK